MTHLYISNQLSLAVACALVGAMSHAQAAGIDPADAGYLTATSGAIVRSDYGLCWNAGTNSAANRECDPKPAPAPVAAVTAPPPAPIAAAPAPAPTPAPVTPVKTRVSLDADTLFDFDKSSLRPAGKVAFDGFINEMRNVTPEMISVVGYTDRFGSESYNQRLSERRAAAVKTYLVDKGVAADRIHTEGKGEMNPVTKAGDCPGAKSAKVIACLQADRRVEVEVAGNRIERVTTR